MEGPVHQARGNPGAALQWRAVVGSGGQSLPWTLQESDCGLPGSRPASVCSRRPHVIGCAGHKARGRALSTPAIGPFPALGPTQYLQPLQESPRIHKQANRGERKKPTENGELKNGAETITIGQP